MKKQTISPDKVKVAAAKIRRGSTLADVSKEMRLPYNRLQGALKKSLGKEGYAVLMKQSVKMRTPASKISGKVSSKIKMAA